MPTRNEICLLIATALLLGCGDEKTVVVSDDKIPPAVVTDLVAGGAHSASISLMWSATGDDSTSGNASVYDVRFATSPISEGTWGAANQTSGEPQPDDPGARDYFAVTGLDPSTQYYFAVKVGDEVPNWSAVSNIGSLMTADPDDVTRPSQIADLRVTAVTPFSETLEWTASGDDGSQGTATRYDIRYSVYPIVLEGDYALAYTLATQPTPQLAGTSERFIVTGLVPNTRYYFAIKSADEASNRSIISNGTSGQTELAEAIAPSAIADLSVTSFDHNSVGLVWTASGDDGSAGVASRYDIRYFSAPIVESNWNIAFRLAGEPTPQAAGTPEQFTVQNLKSETHYYFAMKVGDEVPNWSPLSNGVEATTVAAPDITAPSIINDLRITAASRNSLTLAWLAPGDDGAVGQATAYDMRFSQSPLSEATWAQATQVQTEPSPGPPATNHVFTVPDLKTGTLYYFAIKTVDEVGNLSEISNIASGSTDN